MEKVGKKNTIILLILFAFAIIIVATDLILVHTSLKETGVGRGFSRYWSSEE
jgi:hypothetical protein